MICSLPAQPRPPPASCPGLGPRRYLVRPLAAPSPLLAHVIWSPASCPSPGLDPRRHFVPAQASTPAGISSGSWPLRVRCLPGDLVTGISSQSRPRSPPVSCPSPGLGPRRHLVPVRRLTPQISCSSPPPLTRKIPLFC